MTYIYVIGTQKAKNVYVSLGTATSCICLVKRQRFAFSAMEMV